MQRIDYPAIGQTLYTARLENGLPICVAVKPGYRKSVAAFVTNYGGADRRFTLGGRQADTPAGVAHYLEHKMFDTPEGSVDPVFAANGADANAFTSEAMTAYYFTCTQQFDDNLRTLLSFVSTPWFTQESVDKERGIIAQEIRMYDDDPDDAVYMNLMRLLYGHSPLRDSVAGTVASIQDITPQVLYDCHKVFYHPSNMVLCVVGDVDPAAVEAAARQVLTPDPAEKPLRDYGPQEGTAPVGTRKEAHMEVSAPIFLAGTKLGPTLTGPQALAERLTASLALRCLLGRSAPAFLRLYGQGLLNDTFGSSVNYAAGQETVIFGGESKDPDAVTDALLKEAAAVARNGFDPGLFQRQKKAALGGRIRGLNNFRGLAIHLAEGVFAGYRALEAFDVLKSVTCEAASAWVREHLSRERTALSIIYPKEG